MVSMDWENELGELAKQFSGRLPERFEKMEIAIKEENWLEVKRLAHQTAGAAACYGFKALAEEARKLENIVGTGAQQLANKYLMNMRSFKERPLE